MKLDYGILQIEQEVQCKTLQFTLLDYIDSLVQERRISSIMTSSIGNIFRFTSPLCGEFTGHEWIPHAKASDMEL